jgi:predicted metal-dependent peptidase
MSIETKMEKGEQNIVSGRRKKLPQRFSSVVEELLFSYSHIKSNTEYYAWFALYLDIVETDQIPTCAVTVKDGKPVFLYNSNFVNNELTQEEFNFVYFHEVMHLILEHVSRTSRNNHDSHLANIAQDLIINELIAQDKSIFRICETPKVRKTDSDGNITSEVNNKKSNEDAANGLFLTRDIPNYDGKWIYEHVYNYLLNLKEKYEKILSDVSGEKTQNNGGDSGENSNENGNTEAGENESESGDNKQSNENLKDKIKSHPDWVPDMEVLSAGDKKGQTIDVHVLDDLTEEEINQLNVEVGKVIYDMKNRGINAGESIQQIIDLHKPSKNYFKELKRKLGQIKDNSGVKHHTYKKPNRKFPALKGKVKYIDEFNVVLDTSGSMYDTVQKVISILNVKGVVVNLIEADYEVQKVTKIKSPSQLKNFNLQGFGGTDMNPALRNIESDKQLKGNPTVVITDGMCPMIDFNGIKNGLLIYTECEPEVTNDVGISKTYVDPENV